MAKTNTKKKTTSKKQKRGTTQVKKRNSSQLKRKTPKQTPQKRIPKARRRTGARYGAGLAPARERMIDPTIQSIKKRPKPAGPPFAPPPPPSIT